MIKLTGKLTGNIRVVSTLVDVFLRTVSRYTCIHRGEIHMHSKRRERGGGGYTMTNSATEKCPREERGNCPIEFGTCF